jgi:hypothetical protein
MLANNRDRQIIQQLTFDVGLGSPIVYELQIAIIRAPVIRDVICENGIKFDHKFT